MLPPSPGSGELDFNATVITGSLLPTVSPVKIGR